MRGTPRTIRLAGCFDWLADFGDLELALNMDAWDGYPAARERLYDIAGAANAHDLLVITGDTHAFWQNRLFDAAGRSHGIEIGTSAVTSPRGFYELGDAGIRRFEQLITAQNDGVDWHDGSYRGYVRLTLGRHRGSADYIVVDNIDSRRYNKRTLRSVAIERRSGNAGLRVRDAGRRQAGSVLARQYK